MIPYLLAIAGGYLIAQSRKQDTFADGGDVSYDQNLVFDSNKGQLVPLNSIIVFDEKRVGKESIINIQKKYIKERDELIKNNVSSQELTEFVKSKVSVEYLIENGILSPVFRFYSYAFINTPSLGRPYGLKKAMEIAEKINTIKRYPDDKVSKYQVLIVPSPIVNIVSNIPDSDTYLIYTYGEGDIGISNEDLKKIGTGTFEDGGLLKYCWGGKMADGGKVQDELYVAEFRKGEWTVKDKKNPKGNYTLSSKKENAENVRQFLIDNPSRLKYYRTNEYAKGGKMANGMMADEDEMVYNYVKIKNYPTFQTEEEAKKFIKIGKPFLRKELKEGKIVLVHNGKEYYLAYVKEKMADGAMMERGGKIQTLIMQQNDLDPQGYTLVDYDKEKKEWYWEDYKADTYSSGFKSRKDAYEDLNEYLFKDTEYRYEGKEGTMGQKWPDLPTPTKSHSFREY